MPKLYNEWFAKVILHQNFALYGTVHTQSIALCTCSHILYALTLIKHLVIPVCAQNGWCTLCTLLSYMYLQQTKATKP